jgi:hypothetical protein
MTEEGFASAEVEYATEDAAAYDLSLPPGVTPPLIRTLDPIDQRCLAFQVARLQVLLTIVLPPALTDSARQAVLLRNAVWYERTPPPSAASVVADDAVKTRQAVLAARCAFERSRDERRMAAVPRAPGIKIPTSKSKHKKRKPTAPIIPPFKLAIQ